MGIELKSMMKNLYMARLGQIKPENSHIKWVVYVMTFNDNDAGLIRSLYEHYGQRLIVFFGGNAVRQAHELAETGVHTEPLTTRNMAVNGAVGYMKSAAVMVVDNYVAELAAIPDTIEVYQIWHAAGAIKKFGWDDPATSTRPVADQRRFQEVYNHFTHIVVGSEKMGDIFQRAYRLPKERIMLTGFPRSDDYVHVADDVPVHGDQVLYVPTYRESSAEMQAVLRSAFAAFERVPDKQFTVKLHPTVQLDELPNLPENVQLSQADLTRLMPGTGMLITDYSSAVFDYALMVPSGRTVFFCPDYYAYKRTPGLQDDFLKWGIGSVTYTDEELMSAIQNNEAAHENNAVNELWNSQNDGQAVLRLVNAIEASVK
jgi:CDP-glycerol glycerophosphotransferase (TagB/SpsB family)